MTNPEIKYQCNKLRLLIFFRKWQKIALKKRINAFRKTRIKDIARIAGVSIGTVDRVIHNRGKVAEGTRNKVQKIIEETNYSPNVMAQVLKSKKRFHLVSLLLLRQMTIHSGKGIPLEC